MPWTDYPTDVRQFKGLIQAAANERFGSAATVELVASAAKDAGLKLSFQSYSAIAKLYGDFSSQRVTQETLAATAATIERTGIDQGITSSMIAQAPWSPGLSPSGGPRFVLVTGAYTMPSPEGEITGFFTHRYNLAEVHTYGQLMSDLQLQAEVNAGGTDLSNATVTGISGIEWSTA